MKRLILSVLVLALTATAADAGPLRRLFGRGGCGGCQPAATGTAVPWSPHQQTVAVGDQVRSTPVVVHATSYHPPEVVGGVRYQPIRLTAPVPVCPGGGCR